MNKCRTGFLLWLSLLVTINVLAGPSEDLMKAVNKGYIKDAKSAIAAGADVNFKNKRGETALYRASGDGRADIVALLIKSGADVNTKTNSNNTALMSAVQNRRVNVVQLLIEKGADVNAKNDSGATATNLARGHAKIIEMLKAAGARE